MNLGVFLKGLKIVDLSQGASQIEPSVVKDRIVGQDDPVYYSMNSRVMNYNHYDCLEINKTMSKKLFEGFDHIWREIVESRHIQNEHKFFKTRFIEFERVLIDYFPEVIPEGYDFNEVTQSIIDDINNSGIRSRCNTNTNGEIIVVIDNLECSTSVMVMCFNLSKSYFSIYQGRYDADHRILLFNKPSTDTGSLVEFLNSLKELPLSEQFNVLDSLTSEIGDVPTVDLSYRELLDFIKRSKMDIIEDGVGIVSDVNNLGVNEHTESLKESLIEALQCYPYKSLKKMDWLRKSLKPTYVSTSGLLRLLSDNILNEHLGVSPYILADLYGLSTNSDETIIKDSLQRND